MFSYVNGTTFETCLAVLLLSINVSDKLRSQAETAMSPAQWAGCAVWWDVWRSGFEVALGNWSCIGALVHRPMI